MDRTALIHKMEEYIQDFREQLEKNDPASLSVLTANTKHFFSKLLQEMPDCMGMLGSVQTFSNCIDQIERSCAVNDRETASGALRTMEETVRDLLKTSVA